MGQNEIAIQIHRWLAEDTDTLERIAVAFTGIERPGDCNDEPGHGCDWCEIRLLLNEWKERMAERHGAP